MRGQGRQSIQRSWAASASQSSPPQFCPVLPGPVVAFSRGTRCGGRSARPTGWRRAMNSSRSVAFGAAAFR
eukprot:7838672-Lingulodinium_polyedra.AAC.1